MSTQVLRCAVGGQQVLVEFKTVLEGGPEGTLRLVSGETIQLDHMPDAAEHQSKNLLRFSANLARLSQGVTAVVVSESNCLPVVTADYFKPDRAPASGVRRVERPLEAPVAPAAARRFFVFGIPGAAGFQFALSMSQVLEVSRALPTAGFHFEHSHFVGAAVWRGEPIPVVDLALAARLGKLPAQELWSRMLIVRNTANRIFAIPATGQVRQPGQASQVYAPDSVSVRPMRGIRGVFRFEGCPLLVPDLDALID